MLECKSCFSLIEENERLRRVNKILRVVNHCLRRKITSDARSADEVFLAWCESVVSEVTADE